MSKYRISRKRKKELKTAYRKLIEGIIEHQHPGLSKRKIHRAVNLGMFAIYSKTKDQRVYLYAGSKRYYHVAWRIFNQ